MKAKKVKRKGKGDDEVLEVPTVSSALQKSGKKKDKKLSKKHEDIKPLKKKEDKKLSKKKKKDKKLSKKKKKVGVGSDVVFETIEIDPEPEPLIFPPVDEVIGEELAEEDMAIDEEEEERVEVETPATTPTKIRKSQETESVEDNFIIVPWPSRAEWETVCQHFHVGSYNEVVTRIGIWQKRVPTLPVGVEASMFLLEALIYDEKFTNPLLSAKGFYTEDQARSLYSLAIIRYMNHVSQLATQTLGETSSRPARELAAIVDAPEWLVSLRNEVSHGASAPSIETLRMGGHFILNWLKEKYWKPDPISSNDLASTNQDDERDIPDEITQLLTAYIAARIYKMRGLGVIKDFEIISRIPNCPSPVKTKVAVMSLRNELKGYLISHSSALCHVVSQELIPSSEFYEDFVSILDIDENIDKEEFAFEKLFGLWLPIIKLLESKGKLIAILGNLCDIFVNPDFGKLWGVTARWIDKLLEVIEFSGKQFSKHLVKLLDIVVKHPNSYIDIFLDRIFRLTEIRLGSESIRKLAFLVSLWLEDKPETKRRNKPSLKKLFSVGDIQERTRAQVNMEIDNLPSSKWRMDARGEEYWRAIPLGSVL